MTNTNNSGGSGKRPWALMQSIGGRFQDAGLGGKIFMLAVIVGGVVFTFPVGLILAAVVIGLDAIGAVPVGALRFALGGVLLTGAEHIAQQENPKNVTVAEGLSPVIAFEKEGEAPTPKWVGEVSGLFGVHLTQETKNARIVLKKQDARDAYAVGRMWSAFTDSVIFERYKRGYPITNEAGDKVSPQVVAQGLVIEQEEGDDGSVSALVATGVIGCRPANDYDEGDRLGLCGKYIEWRAQGFATSRFTTRGKEVLDRSQAQTFFCKPLLRLKIERVTLRAADSNSNPFAPVSTVHGDASFAWWDDLSKSRATGLHGNGFGHYDPTGALLGIFDCERHKAGDERFGFVQAVGEGHTLTVGAPGSGKFTAAVAPLLLTADKASIVVFDVKNGEAARKTGRHRASVGKVLVLDPFGVSGQPSGALNPLDSLRADDPLLIEKAKGLTDALYVSDSKGDSAYWDNSARSQLTAFLLHVATSPFEEGRRTLARVREIIRRPYSDEFLAEMIANDAANGIIHDEAENIVHAKNSDAEKNVYLVQQTLRAQTDFLDLNVIQAVTATTTLDPAVLRQEVATLYVVVPESELKTVSRWLRMVYMAIMGGVRAEGVPLHVVMDEFPALGHFPRVVDDMARVRSLGIRMHVVVQSLAQLQQIYRDGWQTFTANARHLRVLSANDDMTQKHVSGRLGRTTVRVRSDSTNRSNQGGGSAGSQFSLTGVPLMTPDQVGRLEGSPQGLFARTRFEVQTKNFSATGAKTLRTLPLRVGPLGSAPKLDLSRV